MKMSYGDTSENNVGNDTRSFQSKRGEENIMKKISYFMILRTGLKNLVGLESV